MGNDGVLWHTTVVKGCHFVNKAVCGEMCIFMAKNGVVHHKTLIFR